MHACHCSLPLYSTVFAATVFHCARCHRTRCHCVRAAAISAVPSIVCEALSKMELVDKPPSWKIMDDRGNVTVVLNWDRPGGEERGKVDSEQQADDLLSAEQPAQRSLRTTPSPAPSPSPILVRSSRSPSPNVNMNAAARGQMSLDGLMQRVHSPRVTFMTRNGELNREFDSDDSDDDDKNEPNHDHSQCDFHCSALHKEGAQIKVQVSISASSCLSVFVSPCLHVFVSQCRCVAVCEACSRTRHYFSLTHFRLLLFD